MLNLIRTWAFIDLDKFYKPPPIATPSPTLRHSRVTIDGERIMAAINDSHKYLKVFCLLYISCNWTTHHIFPKSCWVFRCRQNMIQSRVIGSKPVDGTFSVNRFGWFWPEGSVWMRNVLCWGYRFIEISNYSNSFQRIQLNSFSSQILAKG